MLGQANQELAQLFGLIPRYVHEQGKETSGIWFLSCMGMHSVLFRPCLVHPKTFQDFSSHRILWNMHGTLNIDKKLIAQFASNL